MSKQLAEKLESGMRVRQGDDNFLNMTLRYDEWHAIIAALRSEVQPVAWVRYASDGAIFGPVLHRDMEQVRIDSGAWIPLYAHPQPVPEGWKPVSDPMENWLMKPALEWLEQCEHGDDNNRCKMIAEILRDLWRRQAAFPANHGDAAPGAPK